MIDLSPCRAVILVFASPECPACIEYKPRLEAEVGRWQKHNAPIVFAEDDQALPIGSIAIVMIDVTSEDLGVQGYADAYDVRVLPTTILLTKCRADRKEGAIEDREIYELLRAATT